MNDTTTEQLPAFLRRRDGRTTQVAKIFRLVTNFPGQTACWYAKKLKHPSFYAPATVLRELNRLTYKGAISRALRPGQRPTVKAWRFYP